MGGIGDEVRFHLKGGGQPLSCLLLLGVRGTQTVQDASGGYGKHHTNYGHTDEEGDQDDAFPGCCTLDPLKRAAGALLTGGIDLAGERFQVVDPRQPLSAGLI